MQDAGSGTWVAAHEMGWLVLRRVTEVPPARAHHDLRSVCTSQTPLALYWRCVGIVRKVCPFEPAALCQNFNHRTYFRPYKYVGLPADHLRSGP